MVLSSSAGIWKHIEKLDSQKQKDLLEWQLQAREPIRRFADIRLGDHLVTKGSMLNNLFPQDLGPFEDLDVPDVRKRSLSALDLLEWLKYEHHFLCVGFGNNGEPKIIHYYNTESNWKRFVSTVGCGFGKSLGKLGMIQEMTLPNAALITEDQLLTTEDEDWKMARVVWPDELRRYSVEEIIDRAKERIAEDSYHLMKNNCESFVMWCLCGLKISPQATRMRKTLFETGNAILKSGFRGIQHGVKTLCKEGAQLLDDFFVYIFGAGIKENAIGQFFKSCLPRLRLDVGAVVSVFIEIGVAGKDIKNAWEKWSSGLTSGGEFLREAADKVIAALFRSGGSVAGMLAFGVLGALFGVFAGHLVAYLLSELLPS